MPLRSPWLLVERVVDLLVIGCLAAGLYLLFDQLGWNGSTWDERTDYLIAQSMLERRSLLANTSDPTQGRLPHVLGAIGLRLGGDSIAAFKLPFVWAGIATGLLLSVFLSRRMGRRPALYALAYFLSNPWVLASSRTAASAGDILVPMTSFAFLWAAIRLWEEESSSGRAGWRGTLILSLVGGVAVGAKLTHLVLLPVGAVVVALRRRSWAHVAVYGCGALLATGVTHPLLVTQVGPILDSLRIVWADTKILSPEDFPATEAESVEPVERAAEAMAEEDVLPIARGSVPKWGYLWFTLVGKLTLPFLVVMVAGIAVGCATAWRRRRLDAAFVGSTLFVLVPCLTLVWKQWLNVNYFLPVLLPAITLATMALARALDAPSSARRLLASLLWLAMVVHQLDLARSVAPDYLQAGRWLGPAAQGVMDGPAVNHCQGAPLLIDRLNRLRRVGETFDRVFVFETCLPVLRHDAQRGPVRPDGYTFVRYTPNDTARRRHLFVHHEGIRYFLHGRPVHEKRVARLRAAARDCRWVNQEAPLERFRVYACPASS